MQIVVNGRYEVLQVVKKINGYVLQGLIILLLTGMSIGASFVSAAADSKKAPIKSEQSVTKISVNKANAEQLADVMVGIGIKKAEAIVAWRKQNGKFKSLDQLVEIKGIGEKTLEKNRDRLTL